MKFNIFGTSIYSLFFVTVLSRVVLAAPVAEAEVANLEKRLTCTYPILLGVAKPFAMLATTAITNTVHPLTITGSIGVCPAGAITGIVSGDVSGTIETNTPTACSAQAYASSTVCPCAAAFTPVTTETYADITGKTFTPGAYAFSALGVTLAGDVTFSGTGQFYMHIGTTFTAAAFSRVLLINGATACNIFWLVGSSGTIGANSIMNGNWCATTSMTWGAGVTQTGLIDAEGAAINIAGGKFNKCP